MSGKSSLLRKICLDWAQSIKNPELPVPGVLYDTVLPINLTVINQTTDMAAIIKSQLSLSDLQIKVITWTLSNQPDKVLFLFDGIDEIDDTDIVLEILNNNANSSYVIASRMEQLKKMKSFSENWDTDIIINPLPFKTIVQYVDKFFVENEEFSRELKEFIVPKDDEGRTYIGNHTRTWWNTFGDISLNKHEIQHQFTLSRQIGYLSIMCLIWEDRKVIYHKRSDVVKYIVCRMLHDNEKKCGMTNGSVTDNMLDKHKDTLVRYGKLASTRRNGEPRELFSEEEVESIIGERGLKHSLMQNHSDLYNGPYCFIQHCLKEWFNVNYLCQNDQALEVFKTDMLTGNQWMYEKSVIDLLIQLDVQKSIPMIVSILKQNKNNQYIPRNVQSLLECSMQVCSFNDFKELVGAIVKENQGADILKFCGPSMYCKGGMIAIFIEEIKYCTNLDLKFCFLNGNDLNIIKKVLQTKMLPIKELVLSYNDLTGCGRILGEVVLALPCCQKVFVNNCGITNKDLTEMNNIIKNNPGRVEIKAFGLRKACEGEICTGYSDFVNNLPSMNVFQCPIMQPEELSKFLQNMGTTGRARTCRTLDLTFTKLDCHQLQQVAQFVNLKELNLKQCRLGDKGLEQILKLFKTPKTFEYLERLILCINEFSDAERVVKLTRSLPPSVKDVDFGANDKLGNDLKDLARFKRDYFKFKKPERIGLCETGMDSETFYALQKEMKVVGINCLSEYLEMSYLPVDIEDHTVIDNLTIKNIQLEDNCGWMDDERSTGGEGCLLQVYTDAGEDSRIIHDHHNDIIKKIFKRLP